MYTIREIEEETNNVTHVWFQIKTLEEVQETILKRCFGRKKIYHEVRGIHDHWVSGWYGLWHNRYYQMSDWELDNEIGPETTKRYIVTVE
jgi:hypothetical protein